MGPGYRIFAEDSGEDGFPIDRTIHSSDGMAEGRGIRTQADQHDRLRVRSNDGRGPVRVRQVKHKAWWNCACGNSVGRVFAKRAASRGSQKGPKVQASLRVAGIQFIVREQSMALRPNITDLHQNLSG